MKSYREEVSEASRNKVDKRIPNSSVDHARVLVQEIINHSNEEIYSLSSNFNQEFYKSLENEIENFLSKPNAKFNLIVTNGENGMITELSKKFGKKFNVSFVDKNTLPIDKRSNEHINYIVNDNNAFRYEYSDKNIDLGIVEAIANFNSPKEAELLIKNFKCIEAKT